MSGALDGLRVLDFSRILAGPYCTMVLSDLGADVLKVERPGRGDDTRTWGPPWAGGESGYFLAVNRGKRSLALDLSHPRGAALARSLAGVADVVIENFRPGGAAAFGLDYESLAKDHPRLVYASITGFGQTGPYRDRPGYDALIQAMGGLTSITGEEGGRPVKAGVALVDVLAGLFAATATLAALRERDASGKGQHVDISLLDSLTASLVNQAQNYLLTGEVPRPMGNAHPNIVPYQLFETADDPLFVAVGNDSQFATFARLLDRGEWAGDPRYATNAARVAHRAALVAEIDSCLRARPRAEWLRELHAAGISAGPLHDVRGVLEDPQIAHRGMVGSVRHPVAGELRLVASPLRLSRTPRRALSSPPRLGEGGAGALRDWLGLDDAALDGLRACGAVSGDPAGAS